MHCQQAMRDLEASPKIQFQDAFLNAMSFILLSRARIFEQGGAESIFSSLSFQSWELSELNFKFFAQNEIS